MRILERLRKLPESRKKVLIFVLVAIFGFFLFKNYIRNVQEKIKLLQKEVPTAESKIKKDLTNISKKSEEEFKKIEAAIQEFLEKVKNEGENKTK